MISTLEEAVRLATRLQKKGSVEVFVDKGWIDTAKKIEYMIVLDGDGQKPNAHITYEVFRQLRKQKYLGPNILYTYKARRLHAFKGSEGYDWPERRTKLPE